MIVLKEPKRFRITGVQNLDPHTYYRVQSTEYDQNRSPDPSSGGVFRGVWNKKTRRHSGLSYDMSDEEYEAWINPLIDGTPVLSEVSSKYGFDRHNIGRIYREHGHLKTIATISKKLKAFKDTYNAKIGKYKPLYKSIYDALRAPTRYFRTARNWLCKPEARPPLRKVKAQVLFDALIGLTIKKIEALGADATPFAREVMGLKPRIRFGTGRHWRLMLYGMPGWRINSFMAAWGSAMRQAYDTLFWDYYDDHPDRTPG